MMREIVAALLTGFLFGLGLCLSGMTSPAVVQGFLDIAGDWNPALLFVMAAGVAVTFIGYRVLVPKSRPLWASGFSLPTATAIDAPLLSGAAIFGVGWGLAGYCPGPALVSLASGRTSVIIFVVSMLAGMILVRWMRMGGWAKMKGTPAEELP
ncbi:MAG TPA: DUF6691 family protein [Micropepsaceae bacterium]|nr:DUF6691 family protein [Micropepsaceae bacterium]